jgi:hypothetical protein
MDDRADGKQHCPSHVPGSRIGTLCYRLSDRPNDASCVNQSDIHANASRLVVKPGPALSSPPRQVHTSTPFGSSRCMITNPARPARLITALSVMRRASRLSGAMHARPEYRCDTRRNSNGGSCPENMEHNPTHQCRAQRQRDGRAGCCWAIPPRGLSLGDARQG